jgi:transcriptional regulator with XRE-family HTH domain
VPGRWNRVDEASRRAHRQLLELLRDLRAAREAAGLSQAAVAGAIGRSRALVAHWERGTVRADAIQLARWGAVVGLDVSVRAFPGGAPLRDAGQLRLLARARTAIAGDWRWRTEVPVSRDPRDRRAFDAVLGTAAGTIGLEAITRLTDAQAQVRAALLKQTAAGLDRMVLVLAQTRHNRAAVADGAPTILGSFPASPREVMRALRDGELPKENGIVLV